MGAVPVADETDTETGESAPSNAELAGRVDQLDSKLDRIIDLFGQRKDSVHEHAEQHTQERLDRPSTVAEEIRTQLAEARAKDQAAADKAAAEGRLGAVEANVAELREKKPEAPLRRVEKIMGWR